MPILGKDSNAKLHQGIHMRQVQPDSYSYIIG